MTDFSMLHKSTNLGKYLDDFGYSEERVKARWQANDKVSKAITISYQQIYKEPMVNKFLVGSQREGISLYGESDSDWMYVDKKIVCLENPNTPYHDDRPVALFTMDRSKASPGYTYLKFNPNSRVDSDYLDKLIPTLVESEGGVYLSTSKFMAASYIITRQGSGWTGQHRVYREQHGPSIPRYVKDWMFIENLMDDINFCRDMDNVIGFECVCPSLIQNWVDRKNGQAWPSESVINTVRDSTVYVVPVGSKDSEDDLEWRISFVEAEIHLVRSFNDIQRKMLVMLRHIARRLLNPELTLISSYIMKQVAFWMADKTPEWRWVPDNLWKLSIGAMYFLIERISEKKLENYMMPGTNIIKDKFDDQDREEIVSFMQEVLSLLTSGEYRIDMVRCVLKENDSLDFFDWVHSAKCEILSTKTLAKLMVWSFYRHYRTTLIFFAAMLHIWFFVRRGPSLLQFHWTKRRWKTSLKAHLLAISRSEIGFINSSGPTRLVATYQPIILWPTLSHRVEKHVGL